MPEEHERSRMPTRVQSGRLPQTQLSLGPSVCPSSCPPCNVSVLPCFAVPLREPWHRGRSLEFQPRFVKCGKVAEPRPDFYFLPFFLFSGLYLSFQILHDHVSMGPRSQTNSDIPRLRRGNEDGFRCAICCAILDWSRRHRAGMPAVKIVAGDEKQTEPAGLGQSKQGLEAFVVHTALCGPVASK